MNTIIDVALPIQFLVYGVDANMSRVSLWIVFFPPKETITGQNLTSRSSFFVQRSEDSAVGHSCCDIALYLVS